MRIRARRTAVGAAALVVPVILIGNAVQPLVHPWYAHLGLARLRPDPYGMARADQNRLAEAALDSIVPWGGGARTLLEARLPSGRPAFDGKQRRHLQSVRVYLLGLFLVDWTGLAVIAAGLAVRRTRRLAQDAVRAGALLTAVLVAFCGVYLAVAPVSFLGGFHRVFFSGDSWRFEDDETLRRLFPDAFWSDTGMVIGGLVGLQAALVLGQAIHARRRTRRHVRS